jgi:outer membrane protein OmpA-like peptidoglycan-associated protein
MEKFWHEKCFKKVTSPKPSYFKKNGAVEREAREIEEDIMKRIMVLFVVLVFLLAAVNCASWNRATRGAVIGGTGGGILGGVIGHAAGNTLLGAIIGAAVGGAAGAFIGNYMDKQAAEMQRDIKGAEVQRIGEAIKITFDSGILFDIDKFDLRPVSKTSLAELAKILNKYPDTNILIEGHTDDSGSEDHNMALSRDRAQSVALYMATLEVQSARFSITGYGETQPIVTNDTPAGQQKNRRVDIAVIANDKLKKAAQDKVKGD